MSVTCLLLPALNFAGSGSDVQTWFALGVKLKPLKKWSVEIEEQLRLKDNSSTIDQYFSALNSNVSVLKWLKLGGGFRYIRNQDTKGKIQGYENKIRYNIDAMVRHEIFRFALGARLRYQNRLDLETTAPGDEGSVKHMRLKASIRYDIKKSKLNPRLSAELFRRVGDTAKWDNYRLGTGATYRIKKLGKFGLSYFLEKEINQGTQAITHILKTSYSYSF